ncbi:hypothetical protein FMEAI12_6470009 [Parafrankia sp. Ea1.12]|nr:hypothetical protein FMEAI12_6470009 [Parafrankia sp. Ea1.12]
MPAPTLAEGKIHRYDWIGDGSWTEDPALHRQPNEPAHRIPSRSPAPSETPSMPSLAGTQQPGQGRPARVATILTCTSLDDL